MTTPTTFLRRVGALVLGGSLAFGLIANAAVITIVNNDGAGEGFNDPTPAAPIGGNPATTVGGQRLYVFQYASSIWGATLPSSVQILVNAQFNPLSCTATSATLGSTGATTIHANFTGAGYPGTWYVQSLANRLAGVDLAPANVDMNSTFNSNLNGAPTCLGGAGWYYGLDGNEGTNVELLPVVLHETAHGLGFATTTSGSTGNFNTGLPSIYDRFLYDEATALHWDQETAAQRKASAVSVTGLAWDGPAVYTGASTYLAKRPRMVINSPAGIAGTYAVGTAAFGPALTAGGISGNVVLVEDAVAPINDGCETPYVNAGAIAGNIALLDRGLCTFVAKAQAAQAAGAIALLIANNVAGIQPPGGADPTIVIPVVGISQADGNTIKANLGLGVNVTLNLDPVLKAGADNTGRPLMYAPATFASGSSVSHYDVTLSPNALMEPAINNDLSSSLDITPNLMADIGWFDFVVATTLSRFDATDRTDGILLTWEFADPADIGSITVERGTSEIGPWEPVGVQARTVDSHTEALDTSAQPEVTYYYRLSVMDRSGQVSNYGMIAARHSTSVAGGSVLMAPSPNPAPHGSALSYRVGQPEFVRLAIVDASGRTVRVLQNSMVTAGTHTMLWDGADSNGQKAAPGLYFVTMRTSKGLASKRLAVVR
jgi:hypothetical protein